MGQPLVSMQSNPTDAPTPLVSGMQFYSLIGLGLLLVLVGGLGYGLYELVKWLSSTNSELLKVALTVTLGALSSVLLLAVGKHLERKAAVLQEIRVRKIPVYEELIGLFFCIFYNGRHEKPSLTTDQLAFKFAEITPKLLVWGSDEVVLAWGNFRTNLAGAGGTQAGPERIGESEDIFWSIRRDLGHSGKTLPKGSLLRLFTN